MNRSTPPDQVALEISSDSLDPEWDDFLADTEGGHHVQTSAWGHLKAERGWASLRLKLRAGGGLVGGVQVLIRKLPVGGRVAYAPKGPLFAPGGESLSGRLLDALHAEAADRGIGTLVIQPPNNADALEGTLQARGYLPAPVEATPTATVVFELDKSIDELLAGMKPKTRYNIRLAERKGVQVREGRRDELPIFHSFLRATAARQRFAEYGLEYFERMAALFGSRLMLFVASRRERLLSAALVIRFGDSVLLKKAGWSGHEGHLHPNELLHWTIARWAKAQGCRYYDLEGIDRACAEHHVRGSSNTPIADSLTRFKLGFGGAVRLLPDTHVHASNAALRWACRRLGTGTAGHATLRLLKDRLRFA